MICGQTACAYCGQQLCGEACFYAALRLALSKCIPYGYVILSIAAFGGLLGCLLRRRNVLLLNFSVYSRLAILAAIQVFTLSTRQVAAQSGCDPATATGALDVGMVRATVSNNGLLFRDRGTSNLYEVPKGSGLTSIFRASLLIGGIVEDSVRVSGASYGPPDMWPGPYRSSDAAASDCAPFDRIYSAQYVTPGGLTFSPEMVGDISDWPYELGAPVFDADGIPDNYEISEGDRPLILGDQMLWWLMNDGAGQHGWFGPKGPGIEIRASAYSFAANGALGLSTFYNYRIRNASPHPIEQAYVSLFTDSDLGWALDDFVGSDSTLGLAYFYNADNDDDADRSGYGIGPPALGITVLRRPASPSNPTALPGICSPRYQKQLGLTSHQDYLGGGGPYGGPDNAVEAYRFLKGIRKDGQAIRIGGWDNHGDTSVDSTSFVFPGDPVTSQFWSLLNPDGSGVADTPYDQRSFPSVGPFCLEPGEETVVTFAIVFSRGTDNLDSVRKLREDVQFLYGIADLITTPKSQWSTNTEYPVLENNRVDLYPIPATDYLMVGLNLSSSRSARATILNAVGREMLVADLSDSTNRIDISSLPQGFYLLVIKERDQLFRRSFVVLH